jgi:ATP-dependent DNA helicase RecG
MPEQQNIEFKSSWHEEYLDWICGFANAQGGKIYIGKNNNGNVVGIVDYKELTGAALNEFLLKRAGHTWDDVIETRASFDDIDEGTIKKYLRKTGNYSAKTGKYLYIIFEIQNSLL